MPQILDWVAQSYPAHSAPLNASRVINMFPELEVQDAVSKAPVPVWGAAGTAPFTELGAGPVLGFKVMQGLLYGITAAGLYRIASTGAATFIGAAPVSTNGISVDTNGIQLVWVDGVTGWYYTVAGGIQTLQVADWYPSNTVTFFDTRFCFVKNTTREFFLSPANAIVPFDPLLFATKEATSDNLIAIANSHEQLYLFGAERTEVWYDAGNEPPLFPFQRSDGAIIQRGLAAPYSIVLEDNTILFLGEDGIFYRLKDFVPERMSNHAVEDAWSRYPTITDARALVYTQFGHKMVTLTFPSAPATWVLDLATRRWHERESWLDGSADSSIGRWRVNCAVRAFNRTLLGDSQSGRVDQLNPNAFVEFGDPMRGLLIGPPIHHDRKRVFMKRFEIDVESGVGLPGSIGGTTTTYCANAVEIALPSAIASGDALVGVGDTFAAFVLSCWVRMPEDATQHSLVWSNQADPTLGATSPGLYVRINNEASATPQLLILAWDLLGNFIFTLQHAFTGFADWVSLVISVDTATQQAQLAVNGVLVTPNVVSFSSSEPIPNGHLSGWSLQPMDLS